MNRIGKQKTEVMEISENMTQEEKWVYAHAIDAADTNSKIEKGRLWNACDYSMRQKMCRTFGWKYQTLLAYGRVVKSFSNASLVMHLKNKNSNIKFTHLIRTLNAPKEQREEWIEKAASEQWTAKTLEGHIYAAKKNAATREFIRRRNSTSSDSSDSTPLTPTGPILITCCEFFGLSTLTWINGKTLNILYRGLSKEYHPDCGGDAEKMKKLNLYHDAIKKLILIKEKK